MTAPNDVAALVEAFNQRVHRRGKNDCWPWLGTMNGRDERGRLSFQGNSYLAPRVAWFVEHGEWPKPGIFVCHACDNPRCVNPAHLWLGTNSDNLLDASRKGRLDHRFYHRGANHPHAKLTEAAVIQARREYRSGALIKDIAAKFGVSETPMRQAIHGKTWAHVK